MRGDEGCVIKLTYFSATLPSMATLKTLFLDIDGVLSPLESLLVNGRSAYHSHAIDSLNALCEASKAKIVLAGARLRVTDKREFYKDFLKAGVQDKHFHPEIALERSLAPFTRNDDILAFMQRHSISHDQVVVIDDSNHNYGFLLSTRHIQPDKNTGLTSQDCNNALRLFNLPPLRDAPSPPDKAKDWLERIRRMSRPDRTTGRI